MQLLILRHGIAEEDSPDGSDGSRRLTDEGIAQMKLVAAGLKRCAKRPDVILTSPLVRAVQTARFCGKAFDREPIEVHELAEPDPMAIINAISGRDEQTLMLVGHEPMLSRMAQTLCTGQPPNGFIKMKKASCACVVVEGRAPEQIVGSGQLRWLLTAKVTEQLA